MLAGVELQRGPDGGAVRVRQLVPGGVGHGRRLSRMDRVRIEIGLGQGLSMRAIAALIGVSASTVSREVRRSRSVYRSRWHYDAAIGEHLAGQRRRRPRQRLLDARPELREAVVVQLNDRHSPQQVAGRLRDVFPGREDMQVSHETIYQALYLQGRGALRHELTVEKALRSGRTGRLPQSKLPRRSSRPWLEGARLSERPAVVEDRAIPGHWEGDLVVGPRNSGIITLVERSTRFALLGRLPGSRDSDTVIDRLAAMVATLPEQLRRSVTWDQGTEMAKHARFTVATAVPVFFCDPHSPWQRGSNENLNGLLRVDYFPKGTDFNTVTDTELQAVQDQLNRRPRQTLRFRTPAEKLDEYIQRVALTA
ncbi:IS30 family transposase [Curtobacterium sp. MCBD17_003]|uniref:IS30 family transposase n=1 Tax=Curtobacterium sp. MCBD17_003 TaxID=2175667 RepID=UPI0024E01B65|nr:IS30 family transposase [Curtobacterium sp. MCBD17_003]WIE56219.1 IS30 family transposase [Curtobacterium sp. MCBD17_003]WIE56264.1 IS30 family transposase [Curtobacterium sp. MCBD17_003]WIE56279.1 IS30 family transposase [Curtobacterium sp. MCBD17_003]